MGRISAEGEMVIPWGNDPHVSPIGNLRGTKWPSVCPHVGVEAGEQGALNVCGEF